ncbi:MAG: hypothetical protein ABI860_09745 [Gemmatimonadales bacterium]
MGEVPPGIREGLADRYRLERELGRGGMATVYLATDLRHDRPVALKVMRARRAGAGLPERSSVEPLLRIPYLLSPGWLKVDPTFNPLRRHPRFQRLVEAAP